MKDTSSKPKSDGRQERLRQALRDNLKRRKKAAKTNDTVLSKSDKPRAV
ncbi:MAG: hypothetical protein ACON4J_07500 [Parvibaculales bacterium]